MARVQELEARGGEGLAVQLVLIKYCHIEIFANFDEIIFFLPDKQDWTKTQTVG